MTQTKLTRTIAKILLAQMMLWMVGVGIVFLVDVKPARATGEKMVLLWDTALGGSVPTGWTNASGTYGTRFLRGDTVANVGSTGGTSHTHTAGTVVFGNTSTPTVAAKSSKPNTTLAAAPHGHAVATMSMDTATVLPVYRNLIAITCDAGIPTTIPQYAIALFDGVTPGTGFSTYSSENGNMIRIDSTSGGTGGATTHTHTNLSVTSDIAGATTTQASGTGATGVISTHTHTYGPVTSAASTDNTPPHTEVILKSATNAGTAIPSGMIAMFNGDPNIDSSNWNIISDAGGEAFYQVFMEAQAAYQTGQGSATHYHSVSGTSSSYAAGTALSNANPVSNSISSHSHTASGDLATASNTPSYINVVVAQKQAALGVSAPTNVTLTGGNPGTTSETTWGTGEKVTVTDGGAGWSLTTIVETQLSDGGANTIPNANVKLRTDGNVVTSDTYTIWSGTTTNITEPAANTYSLDTAKTVGTRSSGTNGDTSEVRPTIQVVIPPANAPADYTGYLLFTVA